MTIYISLNLIKRKKMKLLSKKSTSVFVSALIILFAVTSCGDGSVDNNENTDTLTAEQDQKHEEMKAGFNKIFPDLKNPLEVAATIMLTDVEYSTDFLNNPNNADKYLSDIDKAAVNMGVYIGDIGYISAFEKGIETVEPYFKSARVLADKLGIERAFDKALLERYDEKMAEDSTKMIIEKAMNDTHEMLISNNSYKQSVLILTGAYIERLYQVTSLIDSYPKDILKKDDRFLILRPLIMTVLKQEKSLAELIRLYETVTKDDNYLTKLKGLKEVYNNLKIEEQIENNDAHLIFNDAHLSEITKLVSELRELIVN